MTTSLPTRGCTLWTFMDFTFALTSIFVHHVDPRFLTVRAHGGIVFDHRTHRVGVTGKQPGLIFLDHIETIGGSNDSLRVLEIFAAVPPDLHDAVVARVVNLAGHRIFFRCEVTTHVADRVGNGRRPPLPLGQLRMLSLVIVHELVRRHVRMFAKKAYLLEHTGTSHHYGPPSGGTDY